jgi:hypothetical protein
MVFAHQLCALLLHFVGLIWDQPPVSDPASETHKKRKKTQFCSFTMFYGKQKTKSIWSLFQDHCMIYSKGM